MQFIVFRKNTERYVHSMDFRKRTEYSWTELVPSKLRNNMSAYLRNFLTVYIASHCDWNGHVTKIDITWPQKIKVVTCF